MAVFQDIRTHIEKKVLVHLLSEIERNPSFTQRKLANELGIALGLMNQYLRSCVTKGWLRATHLSPKRITYFLTPEGFKEKSIMVTDYLARSFVFFKQARIQCESVFAECEKKGWARIGLSNPGDLGDIAQLVAQGTNLTLSVLVDMDDVTPFDVILVTDTESPQHTFDCLKTRFKVNRILDLPLLHISRGSS
jgi:DNA-binding MarR family transcriptional regulator